MQFMYLNLTNKKSIAVQLKYTYTITYKASHIFGYAPRFVCQITADVNCVCEFSTFCLLPKPRLKHATHDIVVQNSNPLSPRTCLNDLRAHKKMCQKRNVS